MKAVLHNEAIKNVIQKIEQDQLDYIVIDQFAKRSLSTLRIISITFS